VEHSKVRRERMGHITLAAPVALLVCQGRSQPLALLLDISPRNLERVLYFAQYVIISRDEEACRQNWMLTMREKTGIAELVEELEKNKSDSESYAEKRRSTRRNGRSGERQKDRQC
jgi:DNA-directed RNA polymerase subunit beta'